MLYYLLILLWIILSYTYLMCLFVVVLYHSKNNNHFTSFSYIVMYIKCIYVHSSYTCNVRLYLMTGLSKCVMFLYTSLQSTVIIFKRRQSVLLLLSTLVSIRICNFPSLFCPLLLSIVSPYIISFHILILCLFHCIILRIMSISFPAFQLSFTHVLSTFHKSQTHPLFSVI